MLQVASVYLDVAYVLYICFQVYVLNISSTSDVCCIQVFHVASVSCFIIVFRELWDVAHLGSYGHGMLVLIPASGSRPCGEGDVSLAMPRACSDKPVPPARRERGGVLLGRSHTRSDKDGLHIWGVARWTTVGCPGIRSDTRVRPAGASHAHPKKKAAHCPPTLQFWKV
jgi:hypothetical protein